jgi:hypothetical protein
VTQRRHGRSARLPRKRVMMQGDPRARITCALASPERARKSDLFGSEPCRFASGLPSRFGWRGASFGAAASLYARSRGLRICRAADVEELALLTLRFGARWGPDA